MPGKSFLSRSVGGAWLDLERAALGLLALFGSRFGPSRQIPSHLRTGLRGELEALFHLRKQGYIVVARRWRCTEERGDLDLVGWDAATLCFIEVKARTTRNLIPAEFAVDRDKQRMLRAMARAYERRMPRTLEPAPIRFDIVSVYLLDGTVECELIRDAFPVRRTQSRGWQ